jgi:Tfp pilus assembly protein PilV
MKKSMRNERGFTIIEAAIALVVMSVVGLGAASLFVFAIKFNSGANQRANSLALAQQRMEEMRSRSFSHSTLNATSAAGVYEYPHLADRPYAVKKTVTNSTSTLKVITLEVGPAGVDGWEETPVVLTSRRASTSIGKYIK